MAAAIIGLVGAALPILTPFLTSAIHHVEVLFGAGTGPTKLDTVVNAGLQLAGSLSTAGKIPGTIDVATMTTFVQTLVQELQAQGLLNPTSSASIIAGQGSPAPIKLASKQSITVTAS